MVVVGHYCMHLVIWPTPYEICSSSSLGDVVPTSPSGMNFDYDIDEVPKIGVPELASSYVPTHEVLPVQMETIFAFSV